MDKNTEITEEITLQNEGGKVNISDDVVAAISGIATTELDGVFGMAGSVVGGIAEKLGAKKSPQKGVKVVVKPEGATIDLYVVVEFGVRIPELAWNIQENVKNSVETMTGIEVLKVNVHIDGVHFKEDEKPAKKSTKKSAKAEKSEEASEVCEKVEDASEE